MKKTHRPIPAADRRFRPGPDAMSVEKAKDFKGTIKNMIAYIGSYRIGVLIV
jgi:hypothetical protein